MNRNLCYRASFNVGNIEVWSSNLYFDKKNVISEIKKSKLGIVDSISSYILNDLEDSMILEIFEIAISEIIKHNEFKNIDNKLDFFIQELDIL